MVGACEGANQLTSYRGAEKQKGATVPQDSDLRTSHKVLTPTIQPVAHADSTRGFACCELESSTTEFSVISLILALRPALLHPTLSQQSESSCQPSAAAVYAPSHTPCLSLGEIRESDRPPREACYLLVPVEERGLQWATGSNALDE